MKYFYVIVLLISNITIGFGQWNLTYERDDVYFSNLALKNNQLFIGSENVVIFQQVTTDSFSQVSLQEYGLMGEIQFLNSNIGYVGGGCYFTFDACPPNTVYKTIDGGKSWTHTGGLNPSEFGFGVVIDLEIIDEQKVFALSEYYGLHYSENGGETWELVTVDSFVNNYQHFQFVDETVGFMVARVYQVGMGIHSIIYKTEDSGQNWSPIYDSKGEVFEIQDSYFIDASICFITTNTGKLLKSTDNGETWIEQPYSSDELEIGRNITFITPEIGYLATFQHELNHSVIYKTTDSGMTWNVDFESEGYITDLIFSDPNNGYAILDSRKIYQRTGTRVPTTDQLDVLLFPNPSTDHFNIQNQNIPIESYQLNVLSTAGQLLYSSQQIFSTVDTKRWSAGIYFVELRDKTGRLLRRGKLVKSF